MDVASTPQARLGPATAMGTVRLTVTDLARSRAFYEDVLGLTAREGEDGSLAMTASGDLDPLVELHGDSSAPPRDPSATGLFHLALLMPDRVALAHALGRLARRRWPLDGASDHLVSEALYLSDPDGNGIEIYRDRPRSEWPRLDGQIRMATLPLDLRSILDELDGNEPEPAAPHGSTIGHVHLQVADLASVEAFYAGVLGFEVTVRGYPGALFVSAGGYHHHLGLNTWNSRGAGPPVPGSVGLREFEVHVAGAGELEGVLERIDAAALPVEHDGERIRLHDPSGNVVVVRVAATSAA